MKTSKIKLIVALLVSAFVFVTASSFVMAGPTEPQVKKIEKKIIPEMQAQPMKLACDVSIMYIEYFDCPCDLDMDVFYVDKRIAVKLWNEKLNPNVKLTVKYFDIPTNRVKTITKNVSFTGRSGKKITILNRPVLIKKSYGVKAEVEVTNSNMTDTNLSNNHAEQLLCGQVPE